jgi:hypothetical protein
MRRALVLPEEANIVCATARHTHTLCTRNQPHFTAQAGLLTLSRNSCSISASPRCASRSSSRMASASERPRPACLRRAIVAVVCSKAGVAEAPSPRSTRWVRMAVPTQVACVWHAEVMVRRNERHCRVLAHFAAHLPYRSCCDLSNTAAATRSSSLDAWSSWRRWPRAWWGSRAKARGVATWSCARATTRITRINGLAPVGPPLTRVCCSLACSSSCWAAWLDGSACRGGGLAGEPAPPSPAACCSSSPRCCCCCCCPGAGASGPSSSRTAGMRKARRSMEWSIGSRGTCPPCVPTACKVKSTALREPANSPSASSAHRYGPCRRRQAARRRAPRAPAAAARSAARRRVPVRARRAASARASAVKLRETGLARDRPRVQRCTTGCATQQRGATPAGARRDTCCQITLSPVHGAVYRPERARSGS